MIIYKDGSNELNKTQVRKTISFLRKLAKNADPKESDLGICYNLNYFLVGIGAECNGYLVVTNLAVGFPNVRMGVDGRANNYPIGQQMYGNLWEKGNRRTKLCTHIANRLQKLLDSN